MSSCGSEGVHCNNNMADVITECGGFGRLTILHYFILVLNPHRVLIFVSKNEGSVVLYC
jgi:hypothetical protein